MKILLMLRNFQNYGHFNYTRQNFPTTFPTGLLPFGNCSFTEEEARVKNNHQAFHFTQVVHSVEYYSITSTYNIGCMNTVGHFSCWPLSVTSVVAFTCVIYYILLATILSRDRL